MTKVDIWLPLYIGDYLGDTQRLSTEQHGAYLLLIMDYWRNGAPPNDPGILQRITRLSPSAWRKNKDVILSFFRPENGFLWHSRIERELEDATANRTAKSERASRASRARWGLKPKTDT